MADRVFDGFDRHHAGECGDAAHQHGVGDRALQVLHRDVAGGDGGEMVGAEAGGDFGEAEFIE